MNHIKFTFILACIFFLGRTSAQRVVFNYTGSVQTWTVPCGVTSVTIDMAGAEGGNSLGTGGRVQCVYATSSGTVFHIYAGGQGAAAASGAVGGWNGGGNAGISNGGSYGSGGGGASDIRVGGIALTNRVIVAGGGGGINTDNNNPGLGGGLTGGNSNGCCNLCFISWATGGSQVAGGNDAVGSGTCCTFTPTPNGSLGIGGNGAGPSASCNNGDGGGGGGGGYYGGGGGGGYGSGAGGSSFTNASCSSVIHTQGYQSGDGYVILTWTILENRGIVISNINCNGESAGSAYAMASGGALPYSYSWAPTGGSKDTAIGLTAGTYTVTVSDSCGTLATATVSITQPNALYVSTDTIINVLCNGENNGSVSSNVSGGVSPYTYSWSNGGSNSKATGLSAGTYSIKVTDANGCTNSATTIITQPAPIKVIDDSIMIVINNANCTDSAGVKVSGGSSPYTYSWSNGKTTDSIFNLCYGIYCCKITDANACQKLVCIRIIPLSGGIANIASGSGDITVYPNPNNGQFTIVIVGEAKQSHGIVEVYNVLGEKVYSQLSNFNAPLSINLSNQPDGIYLYRIVSESGKMLGEGKIMIQK